MALILPNRYPGRFNPPSTEYPQGSFKNRTAPGALDGSYLEQDWANDKEGFFQSLLDAAAIAPNDSVDEVGDSQYYTALQAVIAAGLVVPDASTTTKGIIEIATDAESASGASGGLSVPPSGLAAREAARRYTSAQQLMPNGGTITLSHGLGVVPFSVVLEMVCVTTERGYSPGDIIQLEWACTDFNVATRQGYGATVVKSSTQVRVYLANNYSFVAVSTGGVPAVLTPANWRLVVRAQA